MAKAQESSSDRTQVSVEQFAAVVDSSPDDVRSLAKKGVLPSVAGGRISLFDGVKRLIQHLRSPEVSIVDAALVIDVSQQWVRELIQQGFINKLPNGRIRRDEVWTGYIKWLRDEGRRSSKGAAENKIRDAKTKEIELRLATRQRELIPLEDASSAMADLCGMVRQEMDGIAARITRDVALRKLIDDEIRNGLDRISALASEQGKALQSGSIASETSESDDT